MVHHIDPCRQRHGWQRRHGVQIEREEALTVGVVVDRDGALRAFVDDLADTIHELDPADSRAAEGPDRRDGRRRDKRGRAVVVAWVHEAQKVLTIDDDAAGAPAEVGRHGLQHAQQMRAVRLDAAVVDSREADAARRHHGFHRRRVVQLRLVEAKLVDEELREASERAVHLGKVGRAHRPLDVGRLEILAIPAARRARRA